MNNLPVYIGPEAVSELLLFCRANGLEQFSLIADPNTFAALGQRVEKALRRKTFDVKTVILNDGEVIADEAHLIRVLLAADRENRTYIAVGSGTITDITRLISHRTGATFISMPTAPSVDGFASIGAPVVINGLKQTILAHPPQAIFADLATLQAAPGKLIAAGFGDMMGKFTSIADWQLGQLLWDEPYDQQIAMRSVGTAQTCAEQAKLIGQRSAAGITRLTDSLIESGFCMLDFGSSRPASGAEHHCSHYWEMKLLREQRPAILHGAKVGFATMLIAERYEQIRALNRSQVINRLETAELPDRSREVETIGLAYGSLKTQIITAQEPFLDMSAANFTALKQRIIDRWEQIQKIAARVPTTHQIKIWLQLVDGPTTAQELGLSDQEVELALKYSHYLRERFTVMKLCRLLDI